MSHSQSDSHMGDQVQQILETDFSTELHISESDDDCCQSHNSPAPQSETSTLKEDVVDRLAVPPNVVLSTQSPAALKVGTQQLIPKNLATASRPKNRYHTTVVTFPVGLENSKSGARSHRSCQGADVSWEDYDSDGEGFALRRNRRNKSYRAAVTSLDIDAMVMRKEVVATLEPVKENKVSSPGPARSPGRKRTLGRKRNQKHRGSFKDATPCLYQEIRERGLHSTNQDELLDDFVVVEPPVADQNIVVTSYRPVQLTWSQLPQVKDTDILSMISPQERKRQEAIFEIITSEHSYLHSLGILVRHFKDSEALRKTMTATEHHHLFSNISVIHQVSKRFFEDLEQRHSDNPVIRDISDIVQNHAAKHFEPYIVYCSNETFQQRTLQKLLTKNTAFKETLKQIEGSKDCGGLPMISFLILPMQRVTRLPLLLDTICQKTPDKTKEYFAAVWALHAISKLVTSCNDGARRMERTELMYTIQKQMDFGKIKPFPLVSSSRWLKKRGELAVCAEELSIWKAFSNRSYYLFLFNDVLIVTKKKSEESFVVMDYATVENVEVEFVEDAEGLTSSPGKNSYYLSFRLLMRKNSEGRAEQISLVAESRVDRARWIVALKEHKQARVSMCTDGLPQYEATKAYMPKGPDELGLQQAELVIVLQKEEAWCYGERMRDGERGWFPASCATEITNPTAMESNVQRMKRLRKETNV
uniref:Rho guanine nucleotide exchange factor (GEF) 16 n=1 Tax=Monopterus albus TaxID=43700 RepID=A0A3Q3IME1_MONAL|nr:rho guanine nucleotide exchange factor 16 [Monopterus albus]XP_020473216.1 rho guanine nucleotide exchange factor 16 [Monopterus albus]XP_020473223.1 rho guanine nucleotide exchange factor 16 [Monopterus albus]XP_020473232.1 rho guanine nucleotide exchange factor 16 [Monopterus albus]XP_020473239.1 rho guanine nucleotide exchange factor 16 [Monopterus albus]